MNTLSYIKTVDGNKNIQDLKEKLFRAAPDLEHAIITDAATIAAQAQTIERLADALEFALAYTDTTNQAQPNWQKYTAKHWPNGLDVEQLRDALTAARALLAEIRGRKE